MQTSNEVLDAVLEDLSVPHIEERLSRDFFFKLGLKYPQQYGIACRDVAACVRRAEALGAGPFLYGIVGAPGWVERGEAVRKCKLEVALGYAGDAQIEFLGPGQGTEHYSRALVDTDVAFHHVGIFQPGIEGHAKAITEAGYPEVVRGGLSFGKALNIDFRYFDSRADHGIYLEVLDLSVAGIELSLGPVVRAYGAVKNALGNRART